jgi:hypothetical protein
MQILSTRTFAVSDDGNPLQLPRTPPPTSLSDEDAGARWLSACYIADAEETARMAAIAAALSAARAQPWATDDPSSDAWLAATTSGFAR